MKISHHNIQNDRHDPRNKGKSKQKPVINEYTGTDREGNEWKLNRNGTRFSLSTDGKFVYSGPLNLAKRTGEIRHGVTWEGFQPSSTARKGIMVDGPGC